MIRRTVVGWDDSAESRTAVAWAIEQARHAPADHELMLDLDVPTIVVSDRVHDVPVEAAPIRAGSAAVHP